MLVLTLRLGYVLLLFFISLFYMRQHNDELRTLKKLVYLLGKWRQMLLMLSVEVLNSQFYFIYCFNTFGQLCASWVMEPALIKQKKEMWIF